VILKKWLKAGYVYQNELFPTDADSPQVGIISPVAADMTLDGLEAMLAEKFPRAKPRGLKNEHSALLGRLHYYRTLERVAGT
jgi:RNA-directed DNA polymerase